MGRSWIWAMRLCGKKNPYLLDPGALVIAQMPLDSQRILCWNDHKACICLKIRWPETTWESHIQLDLRNEKQVDDFSQIAAIKPVMCSWSSACLILVLQKQRWVEVAEAVKNRHSSHLRHRFRFCISKAVAFCHFVEKMLMSNQSQFHIASWENVLIAGNVLLSASSTTQRT